MPKVKVTNAANIGRELRGLQRSLPIKLENTITNIGQKSRDLIAAEAPKRKGTLAAGVRSRRRGIFGLDITIHARSESGFDYSLVSRFGHQAEFIDPIRFVALGINLPGGKIHRAWARGFRPVGDWVDRAMPEVEGIVNQEMRDLGRSLELRVFSG